MILRNYAKLAALASQAYTSSDTLTYGYRLVHRIPLSRGFLGIAGNKAVLSISIPGNRKILDKNILRTEKYAIEASVRSILRINNIREVIVCGWGLGGSVSVQIAHDLREIGYKACALGFGSLCCDPLHSTDQMICFRDDPIYKAAKDFAVAYDRTGSPCSWMALVWCGLFPPKSLASGPQEYAESF